MIKLLLGDCKEILKTLDENSVDSVVTDPPYELGFMNKSWDSSGIANDVEMWKEVLRVLKPGGYLLSFGGTRTYHRMACAVEDAGFEIRDCLEWLYSTGFPKSMDIQKSLKKKFGDDFEEAEAWKGYGTCLKPSWEPILMARKLLSEKTVAENVLKWKTGGLNIDVCRISVSKNKERLGRFPANTIFDEEAGKILDLQSGITKSGRSKAKQEAYWGESNTGFLRGISTPDNQYDDAGGASRFFYCIKASKKERGEGNIHPTVKPLALMEYLVKLVTPSNGIVFDPFMGSGTTGLACKNLNFSFIGIEMNLDYYKIAESRLA